MEPSLDTNIAVPNPCNRTSVGNSSRIYTQMIWYDMLMANLPIIASVITNHDKPEMTILLYELWFVKVL